LATSTRRFWLFPLLGLVAGGVFAFRAATGADLLFITRTPGDPPLSVLIAVLLSTGAAGGLLVAMAYPMVRWIGGSFLLGALALFPVLLGLELATRHRRPWQEHLGIAGVIALFIGGFVGAGEWLDKDRPHRLAHLWVFAAVCAPAAWYTSHHWHGHWAVVTAAFLFFVPLALALMVSVAAIDAWLRRDHDGGD
jgi:hypothetical protein